MDAATAATSAPSTLTGASRRSRGLGRFVDRYLLVGYTVLAVIYLMLPVSLVILFSFNNPAGHSNVVWQGFTLRYWLDPLGSTACPARSRRRSSSRSSPPRSRPRSAPSWRSLSSATSSADEH